MINNKTKSDFNFGTSLIIDENDEESFEIFDNLSWNVVNDFSWYNYSIIKYLERNLRIWIESVCSDFVKDLNGKTWFINLHSFFIRNADIPL